MRKFEVTTVDTEEHVCMYRPYIYSSSRDIFPDVIHIAGLELTYKMVIFIMVIFID